jgi:ribonuclease HII
MAVVTGIDEAGYGPLIGPLVVSQICFAMPDEYLGRDMWDMLSSAVARNKKALAGRILITDSKKAFVRSTGLGHLERTVLAFLNAAGFEASDLQKTLNYLCPECSCRLPEYPWYANLKNIALETNTPDICLAGSFLNKAMAQKDIKFIHAESRCFDVAHYNKMVTASRNKASVLFTAVCSLIQQAFEKYGHQNLQIIVDRQSGRMRYRQALAAMFGSVDMQILREDERDSSYQITAGNKRMKIHFVVEGDDKFMPVSLASMFSKYIREQLIECINKYFISHCQNIKPTAGYWKDGQRFIKELKTKLPHLKYEQHKLVRCR